MKKNHAFLSWIPAAILGAACALTPCTAYAESRLCASAWIPEQFILPDGSMHDSGTLKICTAAPMSPVAQLQKTYVDGMPLGAFLSRSDDGELNVTDNIPALFVFMRDASGLLCLERYAVWDGRKARSFDMTPATTASMTVALRSPVAAVRQTIIVAASRN